MWFPNGPKIPVYLLPFSRFRSRFSLSRLYANEPTRNSRRYARVAMEIRPTASIHYNTDCGISRHCTGLNAHKTRITGAVVAWWFSATVLIASSRFTAHDLITIRRIESSGVTEVGGNHVTIYTNKGEMFVSVERLAEKLLGFQS